MFMQEDKTFKNESKHFVPTSFVKSQSVSLACLLVCVEETGFLTQLSSELNRGNDPGVKEDWHVDRRLLITEDEWRWRD